MTTIFHLVDASFWPLLVSASISGLGLATVAFAHGVLPFEVLGVVFVGLLVVVAGWCRDIIREAVGEGQHSTVLQDMVRLGFMLFIVSEVMFFAAFFWTLLWHSCAPDLLIGGYWPSLGLAPVAAAGLPFWNTIVLLSSGCAITWAHHAVVHGDAVVSFAGVGWTLVLAVAFIGGQCVEYVDAPFSVDDAIYGSVFYILTGFHGFHVIVGACMLAVVLVRLGRRQLTQAHHLGFETAAWYWHFVDVVWLGLFLLLYCV